MELIENIKTGEKKALTSWKSPSDPAVGSFSAGIHPSNIPEILVWSGSCPFWRSGPWNGHISRQRLERLVRDGEYYERYDETGRNSGPFAKFLLECGIDARYTMSGTPQQNGVAERRNRTLLDMYWLYVMEKEPKDIQKFSSNGADLDVCVPYSALDKSRYMKTTVTVTVTIGVIFIAHHGVGSLDHQGVEVKIGLGGPWPGSA
ncbi:putative inactive G-type lectin S-receptor-like serine/threonine-protein kinase SRK [Vitis riparia]|uniref:putative inactive G-type lectin S-receptor-like serine/threonine-protein kinase SRK n=1 Tax=Vitis riparia TaxID=96939 RepID=UPI00155B1C18|nr:putative inactive G-type lectin S-receptor-like serine/threonine-protein kinase SRK [Vitis riparia]